MVVVYRETCVGDVDVVVTSKTSSEYVRNIRVRLSISDVNDHAPRFNPSSVVLNISEVQCKATEMN